MSGTTAPVPRRLAQGVLTSLLFQLLATAIDVLHKTLYKHEGSNRLHRLLRTRLGAHYDPHQHLGGALYFFLRGIDGPCAGEYAVPATPEVLALLDTLDHLLTDEVALA